MALVRMLLSTRDSTATPVRDAVVNTLYFNVSGSVGQDPDYGALVNDLATIWKAQPWVGGRFYDIRAYNMDDPEPRPIKAQATGTGTGTKIVGVPQVALCLSYFADRNLPRQRGRVYLGPWSTGTDRPTLAQMNNALQLGNALAGLGGINVDWSLYSPTTGNHTRLSHIWVDNSWDIIRSRKLPNTSRVEADING